MKATTNIPACLLMTTLAGWASWAFAHARLDPTKSLKPRSDSSGLKTAPCGDVAATTDASKRTELVAGSTLTIEWQETIDHPGWFRIAFSPDGETGFDDNVLKDDITDDKDGSGIRYDDPSTYVAFKTTIKVPDEPCEGCSIQLIQVMTDRNPPTNYYSCADIRIIADDGSEAEKPATPTGLKVTGKRLTIGGD
jgi:hypothetical protein